MHLVDRFSAFSTRETTSVISYLGSTIKRVGDLFALMQMNFPL